MMRVAFAAGLLAGLAILKWGIPVPDLPFQPDRVSCYVDRLAPQRTIPSVVPHLSSANNNDADRDIEYARKRITPHIATVNQIVGTCTANACSPDEAARFIAGVRPYLNARMSLTTDLFQKRGEAALDATATVFASNDELTLKSALQSLVDAKVLNLADFENERWIAALLASKDNRPIRPCKYSQAK